MLTTVIIPTYNRAAFLPRAVASLWRQRDSVDLDILIVDDGSTDETPAVIDRLRAEVPVVRSVHQPNGGVAAARNLGLASLKPETEIVTFLDSDDVVPEGRFAPDLAVLAGAPELDLTYGRMMLTRAIEPDTLRPVPDASSCDVFSIHLSAALMRRRLVERIGLFDTAFRQAEDTDYLLRIFESGTRFRQTDTLTLIYIQHTNNMTQDVVEAKRYFALAVHKSIRRRQADPGRVMNKPDFSIALLRDTGWGR